MVKRQIEKPFIQRRATSPGGCPGQLREETLARLSWILEKSRRQAIVDGVLVPLCPPQSMTSVTAINCVVAGFGLRPDSTPTERLCRNR